MLLWLGTRVNGKESIAAGDPDTNREKQANLTCLFIFLDSWGGFEPTGIGLSTPRRDCFGASPLAMTKRKCWQ
jgi:hypothetical protein